MTNLVIKPYISAFRSQILSVWERSVLGTHHFLTSQDFKLIKANLVDYDFSLTNLHCLMNDNTILGFIALTDNKIDMLFLDPEHIGKGLGKHLMNFALSTLNANKVDVNEQNSNAVAFYQKFGFTTYEHTKLDDFGMPYPLLRMHLKST